MAVNSLYWFAAQHKLVHVDTKNLVLLSQDLLQNGMSLLRASETKRKWYKNWKNQRILERRRYTYFAV